MKSADLLLHTSFAEGLSTVLLEAMASDLPFITTPSGGNEFLAKDSKFGILIEYNDLNKLSSTILKLLENDLLLKAIQHNDQKFSQDFLWDNIFMKILKIYDSFN